MIVLAILFVSLPARAQDDGADRPRVSLTLSPSCAALNEAVVRRVLDVELGSDADLEAAVDAATSRVTLECEDPHVLILLDEPLTDKHVERALDLGATAETARSRLVAISIAELLAASWIELGMVHDDEVAASEGVGSEETRAIALDVARGRLVPEPEERAPEPAGAITAAALGIRTFGVARISGEPFHFSGGGGLALDTALLLPLALVVDVRAEQGSADVDALGSVRLSTVTAAAMLALRAGFGLAHADFAIGLRGGAGILEASTAVEGTRASSQVGAVLGVLTATHVSLQIASTVYFHVGIELGWVFVPVFGTDASTGEIVARIGGAQLAITAGLEVRPE